CWGPAAPQVPGSSCAMPALALLGLAALLGLGAGAPLCLSQQLRQPGDYVLGGLFLLGCAEEAGIGGSSRPNSTGHTRVSSLGLLWALVAKMAVEEINNGTSLLPGLSLGHELWDACVELAGGVRSSLAFLAGAGGACHASCNYSQHQPWVLAVVGPHSSELALVTGKAFGLFLVPQVDPLPCPGPGPGARPGPPQEPLTLQVSYGASADQLSRREAFPSAFRTVPSDRAQAAAMVELLQALGWSWVAAVGSDDEYGRQGLHLFSSLAASRGICVAHKGLLPGPGAGGRAGALQALLGQLRHSGAEVVVVFASPGAVSALLRCSLHCGLPPKVWVASEAWLASDLVTTLPGMAQVGTVLGFLQRGPPLPALASYIQSRLALAADPAVCAALGAEPRGLEEREVGPRCPRCDHVTLENLRAAGLRHPQTLAAYAAVQAVAQALHRALGCSASGCTARAPLQPWQLLQAMRNASFEARGLALRFDTGGNVGVEFRLKLWVWRGQRPALRTVGTYDGRLRLLRSRLRWHTPGNREPESRCSRQCQPGQIRRLKGPGFCCYDCVDCTAGSYQRHPDDTLCTPCPQDQWSPDRSPRCLPRTPRFLAWGEPAVLVLLLLLGLALGLVLAALGLFIQHRDSPLVRAAGGPRACFGLGCLGLVCLSVLLFPGQPRPARCLAQQPLLHLPLTGCLSTLFLQAAEALVGAGQPATWAGWLQRGLRGPRAWLAVLLALLVEAGLCAWGLAAFPPEVVTDWQALPTEALLSCRRRSWAGFGLVHAANAALASLCFLGTFLVQGQPGRYNRARGLTFAALAYFATWVSFVPVFANVHVAYQPAVEMGATLLCALGILATVHLPQCHLLLHQPELNTPMYFLGEEPGDAGGGETTRPHPGAQT
ncbi:Taste receptor type 1 member 3, partial [Galemys pyrenaicus]